MMQTYEKIFGCDDTYQEVLEKSGIAEEPSEADVNYATYIVEGVHDNIEVIDEQISIRLKNWTIDRISKVDLSILRNAVFEILFDKNMNDSISISEALNLARKYSDEKSYRFINGVLGAVSRNKSINKDE